MVRREPIGAHYGLSDWLMQRITAVVITLVVTVGLTSIGTALNTKFNAIATQVASGS